MKSKEIACHALELETPEEVLEYSEHYEAVKN